MTLKFIDLFAGIGGFHLAFHRLNAECVFASEIDESARKTYTHNFQKISPQLFDSGLYNSDITGILPQDIPDFDVLCAGFPCQPFSQAGYKRGFSENKDNRGNMFFNICEIIKEKRPKAIFLENVSHILKHDDGRTFAIIKDMIENQLGYDFYYRIVKASDYGLPQHRARLYMVGFDKTLKLPKDFCFPPKKPLKYTMSNIFSGRCKKDIGFTLRVGGRGSKIGDRRNWEFYDVDGQVRRIGIIEAKMMMGLPENFNFPVSETQAMKQLGNSVAVDAIYEVAKNLVEHLENETTKLIDENRLAA
ncbi:MAG: DNA cytosine methyltransferase [Rickettsiales bacterium]|jgi:DNA (cytosine-5)-methyltransferase 1